MTIPEDFKTRLKIAKSKLENSEIKTVKIISDSSRTIPNQLRKFAKYKGFLKTEYIPEVFKLSAICLAVFFPDVLWKAYPTV